MKGYGVLRHLEIQWAFDFGGRMFGLKGSMTKRARRGNYHKSRGASKERNAQRGRARMDQKELVRALLADSP